MRKLVSRRQQAGLRIRRGKCEENWRDRVIVFTAVECGSDFHISSSDTPVSLGAMRYQSVLQKGNHFPETAKRNK